MDTPLDPAGHDVYVGDYVLRTPGLSGTVETITTAPPVGARAAGGEPGPLDLALREEHVRTQDALAFRDTDVEPAAATVETRSTRRGEPALEIEAPAPAEGWEQAALVTDANGVLSWHFGVDSPAGPEPSRGTGTRLYVIPRPDVPPAPSEAGARGFLGKAALKLVRFVAFKLIDPVAGVVGPFFVRKWEEKKRPYSLRPVTADDFREHVVVRPEEADWGRLAGGRALLLIHGTSSRSDIAFSGLDPAFVRALHEHYEGRVFGFDHHTLSDAPHENVRRFVEAMPSGTNLDLDVITHSRGGLVTRLLAERQADFSLDGSRVDVRRAVLVAVPNAGTLLSDVKHVGAFIDAFTNLLTHVPDGFEPVAKAAEVLASVVAVLKQVAAGTVKGLDGLQAMRPGGPFLSGLNVADVAGETRYFALASNYEPAVFALKAFVADRLADVVFEGGGNDVIVPTEGVYAANGGGRFPISDRHVFDPSDGVAHTTFFTQGVVQDRLREWLMA
jgi:hypothetical protein